MANKSRTQECRSLFTQYQAVNGPKKFEDFSIEAKAQANGDGSYFDRLEGAIKSATAAMVRLKPNAAVQSPAPVAAPTAKAPVGPVAPASARPGSVKLESTPTKASGFDRAVNSIAKQLAKKEKRAA